MRSFTASLLLALAPAMVAAGACGGPATKAAEPPLHPDHAPLPVATVGTATARAPAPASPAPSAALGDGPADGGAAVDAPRNDASNGSNAFTTKLYARLRRGSGNLLVSGASLRAGLGIAYLGARSDTAREMATALELPTEAAAAAALAKAEGEAWQDARGSAELLVANRLWADASLALSDDFTAAASAAFGSAVERVDFLRGPDAARRAINAWVSEKTASKIGALVPEGALDRSTRLVVTNALYFKARWASPFAKSATRDEPFHAAKRAADVPTMHDTGRFRFAHVGAAKVLALPYDRSQLALLVVLPDDAAGLGKLEESLSPDTFAAWTQALAVQRVAIALPRFTFPWGGALGAPLQELGMRAAFSDKADLGGMTAVDANGKPPAEAPRISQVLHRTWIAVDEVGTEAAAATGVMMRVTSLATGPIADFKADHPFLFFVYDTRRGRILFAGRVSDPRP